MSATVELIQSIATVAEVSITDASPTVGVLFPAVSSADWSTVVTRWQAVASMDEDVPAHEERRFIRCDFLHGKWIAVTFYWDCDEGYNLEVPGAPATGAAERWLLDGTLQRARYFRAAGLEYGRLDAAVSLLGRRVLLDDEGAQLARRVARDAFSLGWVQYLTIGDGAGPSLKVSVSTRRLNSAARICGVGGQSVAQRFKMLNLDLSYAAFTIRRRANLTLRVYARPIVTENLLSLLSRAG